MSSIYQILGIPDAIAGTATLFCLILTLVPYAPGKDFGIIKVPSFSDRAARRLKFLGPILLVIFIAGFFPLWQKNGNFYGCQPPISNKGQETSMNIYKAWADKHPDMLKKIGPPTVCKFASIWGQFFEKGYIAYNVSDAWALLFYRIENKFQKRSNPDVHLTPGAGDRVDESIFEEATRGMTDQERSFYRSLIDSRVKSTDFKGTGVIGGIGMLYIRERLFPAFGAPLENEYLTHDVLIYKGLDHEIIAGLPHGLGGISDTSPRSIYVLDETGRYARHAEFLDNPPKGFQ